MIMNQCAKTVSGGDAWSSPHKCTRKAGHGPEGKFCRQHAERHTDSEPIAIWYKTRNRWGFEIEAVEVFAVTDKTLLVRSEFAAKDIKERTKIVTEYNCYWATWEEAVEHLRKRVESQREALAESEKEFARAAAKKPTPEPRFTPPEKVRL